MIILLGYTPFSDTESEPIIDDLSLRAGHFPHHGTAVFGTFFRLIPGFFEDDLGAFHTLAISGTD